MNISAAALPPVQPAITAADRAHPLFHAYRAYRISMSNKLVEADSFPRWLEQRTNYERDNGIREHPRYAEFQQWMRATQGGAPGKTTLVWPENFYAWLNGERW